MYVAPHCC